MTPELTRYLELKYISNSNSNSKPRSSCSQMFLKIDVLKNFSVFTGKHMYLTLFLIKLQLRRLAALCIYIYIYTYIYVYILYVYMYILYILIIYLGAINESENKLVNFTFTAIYSLFLKFTKHNSLYFLNILFKFKLVFKLFKINYVLLMFPVNTHGLFL